jgi:hypothetical protein
MENIIILDNFLEDTEMKTLKDFLNESKYKFGHVS